MHRSFKDKRTRRYYEGQRVAALQGFTAKQAGKCFEPWKPPRRFKIWRRDRATILKL